MVHGEINPLDVLFYSYLLIKAPVLRDAIARSIDMVVDDPIEEYQMLLFDRYSTNGNKSPSAVDILGETAIPHEKVLTSLFPAFAKQGRRDNDGNRISRRRNLLKLLYLGNPPHDISVKEVRDFWMSPPDAVAAKLLHMTEDGRLRVFGERISDLLPSLPEERDVHVWPQIAKSLLRSSDWITGPESQRDVGEDLESAIRLLGSKVEGGTVRAKNIARLLIQAGDLVITPSLMRSHVHRYGLANWSKGRAHPDHRVVYSQAEFAHLIHEEASRYRASIEAGFFLKRAPNPDAIFFLSNLDMFDEPLRQSLTDQLSDIRAIATFAALVVPPGFMTDRDAFERLFDCGVVERRIEAGLSQNAFSNQSDWVQNSVSRFYRILSRNDADD